MLLGFQGTWMSFQGSSYEYFSENTPSSHTKFSGGFKSCQIKKCMKFETEILKNECEILKRLKFTFLSLAHSFSNILISNFTDYRVEYHS